MNKNNWGIILFLLFFIFIILPIILNLVGIKPTEGLENDSSIKIIGNTNFPKDKINLPPNWPVNKPIYIPKEWPIYINFTPSINDNELPLGIMINKKGETRIHFYFDNKNKKQIIKDSNGILLFPANYNYKVDLYNNDELSNVNIKNNKVGLLTKFESNSGAQSNISSLSNNTGLLDNIGTNNIVQYNNVNQSINDGLSNIHKLS